MNWYESIACVECGEQTMRSQPVCNFCNSFEGLCSPPQQKRQTLDSTRGAKQLIGKTIARVEVQAINEIKLIGDDGVEYVFSAEAGPLGIPVVYVYPPK